MSEKGFSLKGFWKDLGTRRWIFLLALGLLLVVLALPTGTDSAGGSEEDKNDQTGITGLSGSEFSDEDPADYEEKLEKRLTELLSSVEGAGQVEVMITLKSSSERVLQSDTSRQESIVQETDAQGGVRNNSEISENSQTVMTGNSSSSQPYVISEIMPRVEGVVVACEGGDRASVQAEISAAVQALFGLEPHKIKVCKMASQ